MANYVGEGFDPPLLLGEEAAGIYSSESFELCREVPRPIVITGVEVFHQYRPDGPTGVSNEGGDVIRISGSPFDSSAVVELVDSMGEVAGYGYIFDTRYDVSSTYILAGLPPLVDGTYGVRVVTDSGASAVFENALVSKLFAHEMKVQRVRQGYSKTWKTGPRILV